MLKNPLYVESMSLRVVQEASDDKTAAIDGAATSIALLVARRKSTTPIENHIVCLVFGKTTHEPFVNVADPSFEALVAAARIRL